jgi:hypothetical protein
MRDVALVGRRGAGPPRIGADALRDVVGRCVKVTEARRHAARPPSRERRSMPREHATRGTVRRVSHVLRVVALLGGALCGGLPRLFRLAPGFVFVLWSRRCGEKALERFRLQPLNCSHFLFLDISGSISVRTQARVARKLYQRARTRASCIWVEPRSSLRAIGRPETPVLPDAASP